MRQFVFILFLIVAVLAACSKNKGPANGKSVQPNNRLDTLVSFTTLINRLSWHTDSVYGYFSHQAGNDSGYINLLINAYGNNNGVLNTVTISIFNFIGPATYPINPPATTATYYIGSKRHYATSGAVTITANTAYGLTGTFNFIADTFSVTNGSFNVAEP